MIRRVNEIKGVQKKRLDFLQEQDNMKLTNLKLGGNVTNAEHV